MRTPRRLCALLAGLLLLLTGCVDLAIRVKVDEDGSATVTERLGFSEGLLDLAAASPDDLAVLEKALSKEGAQQRMAKMGKGVQLVSHQVGQETRSGTLFKQATVVYKIPDINDLRLSPPFPALWPDKDICMTFLLEPCYERKPPNGPGGVDLPGYMAVEYRFASDKADAKATTPARQTPPPLTPAQAQKLRDLLPAVADLARSASIKVTLEAYNTLITHWWYLGGPHQAQDRDRTRTVPYVELLNISGQNRDAYDRPLLADEDTLIEVLRGDWNGPHIQKLLVSSPRPGDYRFLQDSKVPLVYTNVTADRGRRFIFQPSMIHYKRYFEGKTFDDEFAPTPPRP